MYSMYCIHKAMCHDFTSHELYIQSGHFSHFTECNFGVFLRLEMKSYGLICVGVGWVMSVGV